MRYSHRDMNACGMQRQKMSKSYVQQPRYSTGPALLSLLLLYIGAPNAATARVGASPDTSKTVVGAMRTCSALGLRVAARWSVQIGSIWVASERQLWVQQGGSRVSKRQSGGAKSVVGLTC